MYFSEARTMIGLLLAEIEKIAEASADWVKQHAIADAQARVESHDDFSHETFGNALNAQVNRQFEVYVAFGALLGYWARLSLLFHPASRDAWTKRRGELLREVFLLEDDTLLANRSFRDAWVHFDERLDDAFRDGRLGNRLIFVTHERASDATRNSVLVVDVEALELHYYPQRGRRAEAGSR